MKHTVFVYGSLKRVHYNHDLLGNSKFLGTVTTRDKYSMYSLGCFPAIKKDSNGLPVVGELYSVSDEVLKTLDMLEGHPDMYCREEITLSDDRKANGYIFVDSLNPNTIIEPINGVYDWVKNESNQM